MNRWKRVAASAVAVAVACLGGLLVPLSGTALAAAKPVPTAVLLVVSPNSPVDPYTVVSFRAAVSPSSAAGFVRILAGTTPIASQLVTDGGIALSTTLLPIGDLQLTAQFVPSDPSAFQSSVSEIVPLRVVAQPRIWLATSDSGNVVAGGEVRVPATLRAYVTGFVPRSTILVAVGGTGVLARLSVDGSGSGHVTLHLPSTLGSGVYVATGRLLGLAASFTFYVVNLSTASIGKTPAGPTQQVPVPAPSATSSPTTGVLVSTGGQHLAETGTDTPVLAPLALLLMAFGAMLLRAGRAATTSSPRGQHEASSVR